MSMGSPGSHTTSRQRTRTKEKSRGTAKNNGGSPPKDETFALRERISGNGRIRIVVAVQPALFRELLAERLESRNGFVVVGRAVNEDEIEKVLAAEHPAVLVFDYEGLGPTAESTVHRLRHAMPATRILVLASRSSEDTVQKVLRAGASGLVGKQLDFGCLERAILAVARGEIWANRHATSVALEGLTGPSATVSRSDLTRREQEIADGCSRGLRNKEIASHLNISEKTVKGHLNAIFRKLHVDNRLALALQVVHESGEHA
jgi:DNA-binding NarL/FixJ family response regulator